MTRLHSEVLDVSVLDSGIPAEMFALYERYYESTSLPLFQSDLAEKRWVILLRDDAGILRGFSTGRVLTCSGVRVFFSGDTIIDHRYWGEQALPHAFAGLMGQLLADRGAPLYWLLLTKGYRTYRFLPVFFAEYFPRPGVETPAEVQLLIDQIATLKFGSAYDAASGRLRFPQSRGQLRPEWGVVPEGRRKRPDVAFFLERNPDFARGDELVCLARVTLENVRPRIRAFLRTPPA